MSFLFKSMEEKNCFVDRGGQVEKLKFENPNEKWALTRRGRRERKGAALQGPFVLK